MSIRELINTADLFDDQGFLVNDKIRLNQLHSFPILDRGDADEFQQLIEMSGVLAPEISVCNEITSGKKCQFFNYDNFDVACTEIFENFYLNQLVVFGNFILWLPVESDFHVLLCAKENSSRFIEFEEQSIRDFREEIELSSSNPMLHKFLRSVLERYYIA